MGIGDKLLNSEYTPTKPEDYKTIDIQSGVVKIPIKFTHDPIEYVESADFLSTPMRPLQRKFLEEFFSLDKVGYPNYDSGILIAGMRGGKTLSFDTEVMMYDGTLKKAGEIVVGDQVMGPDSKPRNVLETHSGESEMYKIKQSCAMDYVINDSHILSLKKAQSVNCGVEKEKDKKGKKNSYLRYPDEPDIVNIPIKEYLEKSKKWKYFFRGYKAGFIDFPEQPVPIDPYLLSMWLGDGHSTSLDITTMDHEIVDWLQDFSNKNDLTLTKYGKKDNKASGYRMRTKEGKTSSVVWNHFKRLNLVMNKHIPQIYISNSKEVRLQILAGWIDTDGYHIANRHGYEICLANENLTRQIKLIADTLGYGTKITKKKTTNQDPDFEGVAWRLTIYGDVWEIPCKIKRKQYIHNGKSSNKEDGLSSIKVEPMGWGEYAGIGVDGDNLYCLADGTVTHNSWLAAFLASYQTQLLLEMDNPALELGQIIGTRLTCQFIASSEAQAKETAFASLMSIFEYNPYWCKYIEYLEEREKGGEGKENLFVKHQGKVEFKEKNLAMLSLHSNSGSLAGKTSYCCVFDELSRFDIAEGTVQSRTQKKTADAVYNTVSRAAKSLKPFSKVLTITSPMYEDDYGMKLLLMAGTCYSGVQKSMVESLRSKQPKKVPRLYGMHATTMEMAPVFTEDDFLDEKIANPEAYRRDYLAIPPAALSPFFEYPERIEKCIGSREPVALFEDFVIQDEITTRNGLEHRNYIGKRMIPVTQNFKNRYYICADAGEKKDNFVISMGHIEESQKVKLNHKGKEVSEVQYKIIIDLIEGWVPDREQRITVSFQNVEEVIELLCHNFNVEKVCFDQWQSSESIQRLFSKGINTEKISTKLEMYEEFKQIVYTGQVEFPSNDMLLREMRQLNKIRNAKIEHPSAGSKDYSDSVCRTVYTLYMDHIRDAIQGDHMKPTTVKFSTLRGLKNSLTEMNDNPHGAVWDAGSSGASFGNELFGKGTIVRTNVVPNLKN